MLGKTALNLAFGLVLVAARPASGFRNCEAENSDAWAASTRYTVGELTFDEVTGLASGTETVYNYSNTYETGAAECHVTYELTGNYVAGVDVFVLAARRSNFSDSCPTAVLRSDYPPDLLLSFQLAHRDDGSAVLNQADSGEYLAAASWEPGRAVYKTGEQCSIF